MSDETRAGDDPRPRLEQSIDPDLIDLEAALGTLRPSRGRVDRDRLMFEAGRASALAEHRSRTRSLNIWRAVAACLAAVAVGQGIRRPGPQAMLVAERPRIVRDSAPHAGTPAAEPEPEPEPGSEFNVFTQMDAMGLGETAYGRLTQQVLRYGLDGLPAPPPAVASPSAPGPSLRDELRSLLEPGDAS